MRRHNARNLDAIKSALSLGQHRAAVVQRRGHSLVVRVGNGMLRAARELGWTHLAALVTDEDDVKATARAIADNRAAELAEWDAPELGRQLHALETVNAELLGVAGFTADELKALDDLTRELPASTPGDGPRDPGPAEAPIAPVSRRGDLWRIGPHRLLVGDTTVPQDLERLLAGEQVALVVTDPPFAIFGSSTGASSDVADDRMVRPFFEALFRIVERVLPDAGDAYVCCDWRSYSALFEAARSTQMKIRNCLVWDKGEGGVGTGYRNCHEFVAYLSRISHRTAVKTARATGVRHTGKANILRFPRPSGDDRQHHAAKPVELLEQLVEDSSSAGDLVLDLFAGSGSTALAAHAKQRRCALMEIEPARADVAVERLAKFTGTAATLEDGRTFEAVKAERVPT